MNCFAGKSFSNFFPFKSLCNHTTFLPVYAYFLNNQTEPRIYVSVDVFVNRKLSGQKLSCSKRKDWMILLMAVRLGLTIRIIVPLQNIVRYLEKCSFLPMLTNELPSQRNSTRKQQFSRLRNLFENNTVLVPKETSWFGFCPDGALRPILPPQQTKLYIEDWIGLKNLDRAGKVKYISVP
ncbi:Palmitoyl-protein thioesterase 3 [Camellia lanceoleosa]|uniref:Palmitoyl-protein thioesterase 3 n=1 Tax=Camellia lanceoleosa TaxID=1840588 RepID=A0ACC0FJR6_9ERIC|nr:Palmitoyl-protein thioesterase 3 [Camellia lanceoleosa]